MSSIKKKITIYLDKTLITTDNGDYKNSKQKYLLPFAAENTRYYFLHGFWDIYKY